MTKSEWHNPDWHVTQVIDALSRMEQLNHLEEYHRVLNLYETPKERVVRPPVEDLIMDVSRLELLKMVYLIAAIKTESDETALRGHIDRLIEAYETLYHYQSHISKEGVK